MTSHVGFEAGPVKPKEEPEAEEDVSDSKGPGEWTERGEGAASAMVVGDLRYS